MSDELVEGAAEDSAAPEDGDLLEEFERYRELKRAVTRQKLDLVSSELRLAANAMVQMFILGTLIVITAAGAWASACVGLAWWLHSTGWGLIPALSLVIVINILVIVLMSFWARRTSSYLGMQASLRNLF